MCERESENAEREKQQKTLQKSLHKGFKRKQKKTFVALLPPSGQAYRPTPQGNQTLDIIIKKKKRKREKKSILYKWIISKYTAFMAIKKHRLYTVEMQLTLVCSQRSSIQNPYKRTYREHLCGLSHKHTHSHLQPQGGHHRAHTLTHTHAHIRARARTHTQCINVSTYTHSFQKLLVTFTQTPLFPSVSILRP